MLLLVYGLSVTGCTRSVEVPRDQFDMVHGAGAEYLKVRTVSGDTWRVYECWSTDSTLVVALTEDEPAPTGHYPATTPRLILTRHSPPMEIRFEDICWIDRVERDEVMSGAATFAVGIVGAFAFLVLIAAASDDGGGSGY
jgi:hypothetical protein